MARRPALVDLPPDLAAQRLVEHADAEWSRQLLDELDRRVRTEPLERIVARWDLSGAAAARLFGVSRQAFAKWSRTGPPAERSGAVADLAAATDLLERHVKRERIPAIVRRAAPALGGRSLLEMARAGEHREVLDAVRALFDLRRVQP